MHAPRAARNEGFHSAGRGVGQIGVDLRRRRRRHGAVQQQQRHGTIPDPVSPHGHASQERAIIRGALAQAAHLNYRQKVCVGGVGARDGRDAAPGGDHQVRRQQCAAAEACAPFFRAIQRHKELLLLRPHFTASGRVRVARPKKSGRAGAETAAAQRQQDAGQHSPSRHRGPGFPGLAALEGLWPRAGASVKETFLLGVPTLAPNNGRVVPLPEC
mmetsp:Transcript_7222/g.18791  ORF Transcript_7222/g.18791 Transcript_7222/m.18791 type:complete len:215 (+) Transcript_7222:1457-2101(+)